MGANFRLGQLAGEALYYVAVMALHHPELPPSLNRAFALMEATAEGRPGRNDRELKENWRRWRTVAPCWAAQITVEEAFLCAMEQFTRDMAPFYLAPSAASELRGDDARRWQYQGTLVTCPDLLPQYPKEAGLEKSFPTRFLKLDWSF